MSLYAEFALETRKISTLECEGGFLTYLIKDGDCYIEDTFVQKHLRETGIAKSLVVRVHEIAKEAGCKTLSTTINCGIYDPTTSVKACLTYGFKVVGAQNNILILRMEA